MISIKGMIVTRVNYVVTFDFNKEIKLAKCSCGNEWAPIDANDSACHKCERK